MTECVRVPAYTGGPVHAWGFLLSLFSWHAFYN